MFNCVFGHAVYVSHIFVLNSKLYQLINLKTREVMAVYASCPKHSTQLSSRSIFKDKRSVCCKLYPCMLLCIDDYHSTIVQIIEGWKISRHAINVKRNENRLKATGKNKLIAIIKRTLTYKSGGEMKMYLHPWLQWQSIQHLCFLGQ